MCAEKEVRKPGSGVCVRALFVLDRSSPRCGLTNRSQRPPQHSKHFTQRSRIWVLFKVDATLNDTENEVLPTLISFR